MTNEIIYILFRPTLHQRGGMIVLLATLLPLLMLLVSGFWIIGHQTILQAQTLHSCRTEGLKIQKIVALYMNQLMSLNPQAQKLEWHLKKAQAELLILLASGHPNPILLIKIQKKMSFIKQKQKQLHLRQLNNINGMNQGLIRGQKNLKALLFQKKVTLTFQNQPKIYLTAHPQQSLAPVYQPSENFVSLAQLQFSWRLPLTQNFFDSKKISILNNPLNASCSVGLKKRNNQWQSTLLAVK